MMFFNRNKSKTFQPRSTINMGVPKMGMPLFFKLWFGFIFLMMFAFWFVAGYAAYYGITTIGNDPAVIGRFLGEIASGFNEKVK
jgi:hypothetical protein